MLQSADEQRTMSFQDKVGPEYDKIPRTLKYYLSSELFKVEDSRLEILEIYSNACKIIDSWY